MKLKLKIAALLTAAMLTVTAVDTAAFAADDTPANTTSGAENEKPEEAKEPSLGAGAFHSTHYVSMTPGYIKEGTKFTLAVVAYIRINN